jgi:hypothetical protein
VVGGGEKVGVFCLGEEGLVGRLGGLDGGGSPSFQLESGWGPVSLAYLRPYPDRIARLEQVKWFLAGFALSRIRTRAVWHPMLKWLVNGAGSS